MSFKQTKAWKFFSSTKLAIGLLAVIAVFSLVGTLIPQNEEPAFYVEKYGQVGYEALGRTGLSNIYASWWFLLSLLLFSLNLTVCLINRFSLKVRSLGTMITHASVLVILTGALIGMLFGQKGYIKIHKGEEVGPFIAVNNGKKVDLGFSIRLNDFIYSEHIDPREKILVCVPQSLPQKDAVCSFQGPGAAGKEQGVIARISPIVGTVSAIADTGYKIKVLRYLPDFVMDVANKTALSRSSEPNNPAIEAELTDKEGKAKKIWIFARFPDMHGQENAAFKFIYNWVGRQPSDFISKVTATKKGGEAVFRDIRVNEPFRFGGYTFFQSSYDKESLSWSGLQVSRDPGVPVVYAGFILLIVGLMTIFYVNPLLK